MRYDKEQKIQEIQEKSYSEKRVFKREVWENNVYHDGVFVSDVYEAEYRRGSRLPCMWGELLWIPATFLEVYCFLFYYHFSLPEKRTHKREKRMLYTLFVVSLRSLNDSLLLKLVVLHTSSLLRGWSESLLFCTNKLRLHGQKKNVCFLPPKH